MVNHVGSAKVRTDEKNVGNPWFSRFEKYDADGDWDIYFLFSSRLVSCSIFPLLLFSVNDASQLFQWDRNSPKWKKDYYWLDDLTTCSTGLF